VFELRAAQSSSEGSDARGLVECKQRAHTTEVDRDYRFKVASERRNSADDAGASTERNNGDAAFRA
jgi:hypothetical protein